MSCLGRFVILGGFCISALYQAYGDLAVSEKEPPTQPFSSQSSDFKGQDPIKSNPSDSIENDLKKK